MAIDKAHTRTVNAATRQIMDLANKLNKDGNKVLDENEIQPLVKALDRWVEGEGPQSRGPLPPESIRLKMGLLTAIEQAPGQGPESTSITLSDLRMSVKTMVDEALTTVKSSKNRTPADGLYRMSSLPDVVVNHVQDFWTRNRGS